LFVSEDTNNGGGDLSRGLYFENKRYLPSEKID